MVFRIFRLLWMHVCVFWQNMFVLLYNFDVPQRKRDKSQENYYP